MNEIDEAVPQLKFYEEVSGGWGRGGAAGGGEGRGAVPPVPLGQGMWREGEVCAGAPCSHSL